MPQGLKAKEATLLLPGINPLPTCHSTRAQHRASFAAPAKGPALREKLNSGTVVCCADAIPGMREKVVLGTVVELVPRTQLATDVETHSSNSNSN